MLPSIKKNQSKDAEAGPNPADPHFKFSTMKIKHKLSSLLYPAIFKAEPHVENHRNMIRKMKFWQSDGSCRVFCTHHQCCPSPSLLGLLGSPPRCSSLHSSNPPWNPASLGIWSDQEEREASLLSKSSSLTPDAVLS